MKLRFSVGSRAIAESVIVVSTPVCDCDMMAPVVDATISTLASRVTAVLSEMIDANRLAEGDVEIVRVALREADAADGDRVRAAGLERRDVIASGVARERAGSRAGRTD